MACEVRGMHHAFWTAPPSDTLPSKTKESTGGVDPFRMNFLHDLESVFWSFAWVLYCHTDTNNPTSDLDGRLREFQNLFPGDTYDRLMFLQSKARRARYILADDFGEAAKSLPDIAHWLLKGFSAVEESYPQINVSVIIDTHAGIRSAFSDALQSTRDIRLVSVSRKRNLDEKERSSPTQKKTKLR